MARYQPSQRYFLLDEGRVGDTDLPGGNLVSALIALETSRDRERLPALLGSLIGLLREQGDEELTQAFRSWVEQRALLCRQAERKFDAATARRLAAALEDVADAGRLAQVGDWIIECGTAADLLARAGSDAGRSSSACPRRQRLSRPVPCASASWAGQSPRA